jgi:DNA-binding response OmpR family regulator
MTGMWDPMPEKRPGEADYVLVAHVQDVERRAKRRRHFEIDDDVVDPWSYAAKRGRGTLRLTVVEYRILQFMAARPNQALSRRKIAEAVSTRRHAVTPETLGDHIHSLRGQLGFYSDYIQSVPFIGYRFMG